MEQTYSAASKGLADFNLHLLEIAQTNVNATFDFSAAIASQIAGRVFRVVGRLTCASRSKLSLNKHKMSPPLRKN